MEKGQGAKPFLKWAGGKGQLLKEIQRYYPFGEEITKYAEPFIGGGAVLFDVLNRYSLQAVYISDINPELVNTYKVIRDEVGTLVECLAKFQGEYLGLEHNQRKAYYLDKRQQFNQLKADPQAGQEVQRAALMIFLNKTCFNGLYRVNRQGGFNVPMGDYKNPCICDAENLNNVSGLLQNVEIVLGDYTQSQRFIDNHTFVYLDPPYRPLTSTANFTAYTTDTFDDAAQIALAKFVDGIHQKGAKVLVSNSDPKNADQNDHFFDEIYKAYTIERVAASRMINSNSTRRGKIQELLIRNF